MVELAEAGVEIEQAPRRWRRASPANGSRLHQLAPYIGKLKPVIARYLIERYTSRGETVLDCFSGSGTIPLEALLLGRQVYAYDVNPYAVALTRAKLEAPVSLEAARQVLGERVRCAFDRPKLKIAQIPTWVRKFFHPQTLQDAIRFADECIKEDDQFLLACLLSVLHHQRPGFLSYPSSHLVPYLRDKKFPRDAFPDMYERRELRPRLDAKLARLYREPCEFERSGVLGVGLRDVSQLKLLKPIDAIVTSPPYMNALDYVRDNRLRMWFLDRKTADYSPEPTEKAAVSDAIIDQFSRNAVSKLRKGGICILIVGETVFRKRIKSHPAERIFNQLRIRHPSLKLEGVIRDKIPDIRRSRRDASATKRELILVLRKG